MKTTLILLMLLVVLTISLVTRSLIANPNKSNAGVVTSEIKANTKTKEPEDSKYLGYSVDGRTSASVLAAQRSHTVAGKDERNFAIFTGVVVIFIVIFFTQIKFFDK